MKLNLPKTLAILLTTIALSACGGGSNEHKNDTKTVTDNAPKGNLTYCINSFEHIIEPAQATTVTNSMSVQRVYQSLYGLKAGTTELEPVLATSYEVSADGTEYTYHLRHGVKFGKTKYFTPTRDMNADDVVFSIKRQIDKNSPHYNSKFLYMGSMGFDKAIKDVVKVDDYTIKFVLNKPMAIFHTSMNMDIFMVVSKEYAEQKLKEGKLDEFNSEPVGTGPWIYVGKKEGEYTRFQYNPDYWGHKPHFKNLVMKFIGEDTQFTNAVQAGECDLTYFVPESAVEPAKKLSNVVIGKVPALNTGYLMINTKTGKEPLRNKLVRQAISYAIDRDRIVDEAFQGLSVKAFDLPPKAMFGNHEKDIPHMDYNVEKAKELLAKAGYPGGKGIPELTYLLHAGVASARTEALITQNNLAEIGIKAKIMSTEWHTMLKALANGDFDLGPLNWSADYIDPDDYYINIVGPTHGGNWTQWYDPEFQKLIAKAKVISDLKERDQLYLNAAKIMAENVPLVVIRNTLNIVAYHKDLKGLIVSPTFHYDFTLLHK